MSPIRCNYWGIACETEVALLNQVTRQDFSKGVTRFLRITQLPPALGLKSDAAGRLKAKQPPYVFHEKMLRSNCGGGMGPLACNSFVMQITKALVNRIAGVEVQEASSVSECNLRATAVLIWWVSKSPGEEPIEFFAWEKSFKRILS